jgi:hypothetical protein
MVATYGIEIVGRPLSYLEKVGLVLHESRVQHRRAFVLVDAIASAITGKLGPEWFRALAPDDESGDREHRNHERRAEIREAEMAGMQ